ncbi:MAG TPA: tetratricopeptide repeat protein, partial [Hyphomicrobium sp.]|nr:tetratricopeptide repeat protein [Hyphomicrobium sp.]
LPKGSYTPKIEFRPQDVPLATIVPVEPSAAVSALPDRKTFKTWQTVAAAAALVLVIGAVGAAIWSSPSRSPLTDKASIAVLPFDNIGADAKWNRFADGLTEDIVTDLAHSKDLFVIARNSTEVYKNKPVDVRTVGRELGVHYVLEGSIQPVDEQIRVTAQLIDARTGAHVWSSRYDRPATDLFNVQSEVTGKIAATLTTNEGAVAEAERALVKRKPPADLSAYDLYLLAMEAKHKVTKDGLIEAETLFHKALERDPQLARAHVGLVAVYYYFIDLGLTQSVEDSLAKMMASGLKAVELDPDDGQTHMALGEAYAYHGKAEQALAEFDRAVQLAPSDADLILIVAWSIPLFGEPARAAELAERALKLNPHYPDWYNQGLSYIFFFDAQYDKAIKYRLLVKQPLITDYAFLAMAHAHLGHTDEAQSATANVMKLNPAWIAEQYLSDAGGASEKEAELLVDGARKAGLADCLSADKVKDLPNLIRIKSCDEKRAKRPG